MKRQMRAFGLLMALFLTFTSFGTAAVNEGINSNVPYKITEVWINGVEQIGDYVNIEAGSSMTIKVGVMGNELADKDGVDVEVTAEIFGYEWDDIQDESDMFRVKSGVTYYKSLRLDIPKDFEVGNNKVRLVIDAASDENSVRRAYYLHLEEPRHSLNILDVIFRPSSQVEAGKPLFAIVRIENLGQKFEEDIMVRVSIPELGVSARTYINELTEDEIRNEDDEDSLSSEELYLRIPENTVTGDYEVLVEVEYDRGHQLASEKRMISIVGAKDTKSDASAIVSTDATTKTISAGQEVAYKIMVANLGEEAQLYTVEVVGTQLWADTRVEPGMLNLKAGETGELQVYVNSKEGSEPGRHAFTVKVKAGEQTVKELNLGAEIVGNKITDNSNLKSGLGIAFAVLVILVIVIGLVVAFYKLRSRDEEEVGSEGQTYY